MLAFVEYGCEPEPDTDDNDPTPAPKAAGNLAEGKTVTYSSQESENLAANVVDGNTINTRWSGSTNSHPQWVEIDLGSTYMINQTVLFPYNNRAYQYKVEVSTNGASYTQVVDRTNNTTGDTNITDNFSSTSARYVKLTVTGAYDYSDGWTSILEFEVYASEEGDTQAPSAPTNLISSNVTANSVDLNWNAATDNVGVTGYDVYQNNSYLKNVPETSTTITGLSASTSYSFYVEAKDAAGNTSSASNTANITTEGDGDGDDGDGGDDWPNASNTGASGSLANVSGPVTISKDNTVYENMNITSGGLFIDAKNVTVRNCKIARYEGKGTSVNGMGVVEVNQGASATLEYCTLDGQLGVHCNVTHNGSSLVMDHCNCYNANDGVFIWDGDNITIENCYFHDFTTETSNGHVDGIQTEGSDHGIIRHNRIDISQNQTGCISIWNSRDDSDDWLIEDNWLAGGGYTIYAEDYHPSESNPSGGNSVTNVYFYNNAFSTKYHDCVGNWGVWFPVGPTDGWNRDGNYVIETSEDIDNGNPDGCD
jgi:hypothetical protein